MNKKTLAVVLSFMNLSTNLFAVGSGSFTNPATGTKALGMGNAFSAVADDPSAVFFNPAGMSQIKSPSLMFGAAAITPHTEYTDDTGATDKMMTETSISPHLYYVHPLSEVSALGIGVNTPFGLQTKWDENGLLRYVATSSNLQEIVINPVISFQPAPYLTMAAGVSYAMVSASLRSRLNMTALNTFLNGGTPTPSPDGDRELKGDGDGWGYNLGLMIQPNERHSFGAAYRSEIRSTIKGDLRFTGMTDPAASGVFGGETYSTDAETELKFPAVLTLGYAYKPGAWTFAVDGEYAAYGKTDETLVNYPKESDPTIQSIINTDNPFIRDWKSTWNLGIGANYKFNDRWQGRAGYMYLPTVVPEHSWEPSIPDAETNSYSLGVQYTYANLSLNVAYSYYAYKKRVIHNMVGINNATTINGEYKTNADALSLTLDLRFN